MKSPMPRTAIGAGRMDDMFAARCSDSGFARQARHSMSRVRSTNCLFCLLLLTSAFTQGLLPDWLCSVCFFEHTNGRLLPDTAAPLWPVLTAFPASANGMDIKKTGGTARVSPAMAGVLARRGAWGKWKYMCVGGSSRSLRPREYSRALARQAPLTPRRAKARDYSPPHRASIVRGTRCDDDCRGGSRSNPGE